MQTTSPPINTMNLNCSFINRMMTLSEQTDARAFLQKLIKEGKQDLLCGQPESDETAYLLSGFGRILRNMLSCMELSRAATVMEEHVKQAVAARGFTLPENEDGATTNLTLPPETFLQLVHELSIGVLGVDLKDTPIQPAAAHVLQTVFEGLADRGTFAATPAKGGSTIQLESPTGVRTAIFEPN